MNASRSNPNKAPRRSLWNSKWKRRSAFFVACLGAGAAFLWLTFRALPQFSLFSFSRSSGANPSGFHSLSISENQKRALEAKRNRSLGDALAKIDAKTVTAWVNRWTSSNATFAGNEARPVRIDVETLARRHPAWRLADLLERGAISPAAPQIARALKPFGEVRGNAAFESAAFDPTFSGAFGETRILPARTLRDQSGGFGASTANRSGAFDEFFRDLATRDALRARDDEFLARRALEDSIAAAQNGAVPELNLSMMPPELVLELTNLRLQLLRNLSKTPAARAAVREEIRAIQTRTDQIWRDETARQAALLRAARFEIPLEKRRQGNAEIARQSRLSLQNRAETRRAVAREMDIAANSSPTTAPRSEADLKLEWPATRALSNSDFGAFAGSRSRFPRSDPQFFETGNQKPASEAPFEAERILQRAANDQTGKRSTSGIVTALRREARVKATEWAQLAALRLGARRSQAPESPDATAAALEILFPTSSRSFVLQPRRETLRPAQ